MLDSRAMPVPGDLLRLDRSHVEQAAEVLGRAFEDDPLTSYFFPDPVDRESGARRVYEFLVSYGVTYGEVYGCRLPHGRRLDGVAVWIISERARMTGRQILRSGSLLNMLKLGAASGPRMAAFGRFVTRKRQELVPSRHWYLQAVGVDPRSQGKGYASRLLRPMLERIDAEMLPCYLETQRGENVSLYEHFGFRVIEEFSVSSVGSATRGARQRTPHPSLQMWAMLRSAS